MSSPEVEHFEVTQDDLDNEFNPMRRRFRQTKNQATYGIWADDDSDDDERPSFGGRAKKTAKDYAAPVNFVSGGVKVGDKMEKQEEGVDQISDSDEDLPVEQPKYGRRQRPLFRGSAFKKLPGPAGNTASKVGGWEVHTKGVAKKIMEKMGYKEGSGIGKSLQGISTPVEAKVRKDRSALGYYGSERTDRSLQDFPVQPDSEEEEEKAFKDQLQQWKKDSDVDRKAKTPKYVYRTVDELIASGGKKKAVVQSELSRVKVIDMTGKEKRVLSGYHAISHKHDKPDEEEALVEQPATAAAKRAFDMPELLHNLDLLVDMAEDEILQNNKRLLYEKDLIVNLRHEKESLDEVTANEAKQLAKLEKITGLIEECERRAQPGSPDPLTLEECASLLKTLQEDFYEEYKIYDLAALGVALVFPLVKKELENWEPLRRPRDHITLLCEWKEILEEPGHNFGAGEGVMGDEIGTDPYERLLWEVYMPHVRNTINAKWSVRDCDPLIELLEAWKPLLPNWMLFNVLEQLVMPRLQVEVDSWNPLTDTMPIHAWLHPWLPLMGDRLEPLYAPIRHKLANALTNWHPSDPSAKMILQPWIPVFNKGHMDAFLVKNIAPKLALCMSEFIINPHQQHLDAWNWVLAWLDTLPLQTILGILEKHFFPRWQQVLCSWLASNPNYDEVTKWYKGWKSMIPDILLSHPSVKDQMNRALDTMNRAVTGTLYQQPGARESVAYLASTERRPDFTVPPPYSQPPPPHGPPAPPPPPPPPPPPMSKMDYEVHGVRTMAASQAVPTSFKELIGKKAEEHNILFMPAVGKTWEAKQVYRFGRLYIVIDRGVIFLQQDGGQWFPVSLQTIIDQAR